MEFAERGKSDDPAEKGNSEPPDGTGAVDEAEEGAGANVLGGIGASTASDGVGVEKVDVIAAKLSLARNEFTSLIVITADVVIVLYVEMVKVLVVVIE